MRDWLGVLVMGTILGIALYTLMQLVAGCGGHKALRPLFGAPPTPTFDREGGTLTMNTDDGIMLSAGWQWNPATHAWSQTAYGMHLEVRELGAERWAGFADGQATNATGKSADECAAHLHRIIR